MALLNLIGFVKVLRRESYGMSCDSWSVGCCVIMMATGQSPWALDKLQDPNIDVVRVSFDRNIR